MKTYKIKIKNSDLYETIKADSELEAKVKFCEKRGLVYRVYAGKLEILPDDKNNKLI